MTRRAQLKLVRDAAVVTAGASLLLAEAAERHVDASRASYAAQNLRALRRDAAAGTGSSQQQEQQLQSSSAPSTAAWLARDAPQFPFLLGISPGDDPKKVFSAYVCSLFVRKRYRAPTHSPSVADSVLGGSQVALVGTSALALVLLPVCVKMRRLTASAGCQDRRVRARSPR